MGGRVYDSLPCLRCQNNIDFILCNSYLIPLFKGKMTELAEGARLEIVCAVNAAPRVRIPVFPHYFALLRSEPSELRRAS